MNKFKDTENLWFWYRNGLKLKGSKYYDNSLSVRPCAIIDITMLIDKLRKKGELLTYHMITLDIFGDYGFKPDPKIFAKVQRDKYSRDERKAFINWQEAINIIKPKLIEKGFI